MSTEKPMHMIAMDMMTGSRVTPRSERYPKTPTEVTRMAMETMRTVRRSEMNRKQTSETKMNVARVVCQVIVGIDWKFGFYWDGVLNSRQSCPGRRRLQ